MALNNVEFVRKELERIVETLCIVEIINKLAIGRDANSSALEQCFSTPPNLIENWTEKVNRKMSDSLVHACSNVNILINL